MSTPDVKEVVREKYAQAARRVSSGGSSCCGSVALRRRWLRSDHLRPLRPRADRRAAGGSGAWRRSAAATRRHWPSSRRVRSCSTSAPAAASTCLLSARRVGPTGKAYGLDMTDEMLALARENQRKAGVENVEFLKGEIENIPLPDDIGRRHHLQLRHQPLRRQGPSAARGLPRAQAGRSLRRVRRGHARGGSGGIAPRHAAVGRLHRRRAAGRRSMPRSSRRPDSSTSTSNRRASTSVEDAREFLRGKGHRRRCDRRRRSTESS